MKLRTAKASKLSTSINTESAAHYLMLLPFAVLFILFTALPVLTSVVLSFFRYDMLNDFEFVGLDNYLRMIVGDEVFPKTIGNTLRFAIILGPAGFLLSFLLAWFLNEFKPALRNTLAFLFYAPSMTANATLLWSVAFTGDSNGYINSFLLKFGLIQEPINWFQNTSYNSLVLIIITLWSSMGVGFLSNLAGLQNVNHEVYEAGALDGIRTRWHELWYITLPSMKDILLFSAVMQIQSCFSCGFSGYAGYPSVDNSVDTIVVHLADVGSLRYEMGYAAAISVFLFAIMAFARLIIGKIMNAVGK